MILVCYDGSPDAQAAIDHAGELLSGQPAVVLTIWEPFVEVMARSGAGFGLGAPMNYEEIDASSEQAARNARRKAPIAPAAPDSTLSHAPAPAAGR